MVRRLVKLALVGAVVFLVVQALPDLRRYIAMSKM